ncbi:porin family protein [Methylobacterium sp. 77]|uniref:outer membrane protein n=1 Tax=Methylobacterium sp. 77 TaxID=1101192 RepID=UPI000381DE4C|nr:porin family protein [Methylobacterium sp. 77]
MKRLLLATTVLAGLTSVASAADLPRRAAPPIFVPVPVFTWTGAYFGINAGYGFDAGSNSDRYNLPTGSVLNSGGTNGVLVSNNNNSLEGFTGGGQVGYNYQFTPGSGVVVGIEADAQYTDFGNKSRAGTYTFTGTPGAAFSAPAATALLPGNEMNFFGTVRGRIGYAFDRTLVYGTGGFAYGDGGSGSSDFRTGYAAGGGIEYALPTDSFFNFFKSSAVTLKVEGLYVNLEQDGRGARSVFNPATNVIALSPSARETEFAVVRAGLNYKFGSY